MKNDLTCGVVRDLLPALVEGLASEETAEAVERHLHACPDCAARRAAMVEPRAAAEAEEARREVDYLRQVKRRSRRRVAAAVLATAACLLALLVIKAFIIGTPLQAQSVAVMEREIEDGTLRLTIASMGSGNAFHGWKVETVDGVASVYARDVLVSPLYPDGTGFVTVPLEGVREVWVGGISGELVYQEGVIIRPGTLERFEARTPYVGDAPALGRVAEAVGLREMDWEYTTELHTSERPYRWTIKFQNHWGDTSIDKMMRYYYAPLMLALVDNLDEVGWSYTTVGSSGKTFCQGVLTLEEADARLPELTARNDYEYGKAWAELASVKDFAATPAGVQVLTNLLSGDLSYQFHPIF